MNARYPPVGFHFSVEFGLDGTSVHDTRFQEVSGLSAELAVESIQEGGENRFVHRLPGRSKYPNLVLKRGLVSDSRLIAWFRDAVENLAIEPADVTVSMLDETGAPLLSWNFVKAWPAKWSVSSLNAQNNAIAVDTLELAYQRFTMVQV